MDLWPASRKQKHFGFCMAIYHFQFLPGELLVSVSLLNCTSDIHKVFALYSPYRVVLFLSFMF